MDITSVQNPRIKQFVKLRDDKRQRRLEAMMLVEGWDEISLAIEAGYRPQTLLVAPELTDRRSSGISSEIITVTRSVFKKISFRENPDGWLAVIPTPHKTLKDLKLNPIPFFIIAESIEKPGNLGAIMRTADAAAVDALLVCDTRTDIYNHNVVRSSRGTLFTVPTIEVSNSDAYTFLRDHRVSIISTTPQADAIYTQQNLNGPIAIAVGTEDRGLSDFWMQKADLKVKIPMAGKVNSLNVSIATALIVYEVVRQRGNKIKLETGF